jgi:hypothetical protein
MDWKVTAINARKICLITSKAVKDYLFYLALLKLITNILQNFRMVSGCLCQQASITCSVLYNLNQQTVMEKCFSTMVGLSFNTAAAVCAPVP